MFQRWKRAKWLRGTCRDARLVRPFGMEQSTCQFVYSFTINYIAFEFQPFYHAKIILKIQLIENKEVTLFVQLNW